MDANDRRTRATDEAAHWWARLGTKAPVDVSEADREEFTQWLRESPLHIAELLNVAHVHDALERFKLWGEVPLETRTENNNVTALPAPLGAGRASSAGKRDRKRGWRAGFVVAASVCLIAIAAGWLVRLSRVRTLETERAERREVVLNDGSVVNLDPETQLRINLGQQQRTVTLTRGRALFQVAKDPTRPFTVRAGDTQVRVIGTTFGVEQEDQNTIVTVSEGKVAVVPTSQLQIPPAPGDFRRPGHLTGQDGHAPHGEVGPIESASAQKVFLTANQQITVRKSGAATAVREVDSSRELAWSQGRLIFDSRPLGEVVEEFNRYNRLQLRLDGPELAHRTVSGVFRASDPQILINFIKAGAHVVVTQKGDEEVVISAAP